MAASNCFPYVSNYVSLFVRYHERVYGILLGSDVEPYFYLYCDLYQDLTESFSKIHKGKRCKLRDDNNIICYLSSKGASTIYGDNYISHRFDINYFKWTFKIIYKKLNIIIGIDSNFNFGNTDFSNYYRSFNTNPEDIFCGYSSDGHIYDQNSSIPDEYGKEWKTGDIIEMLVDLKEKTLSFAVNGENQGVALNELEFPEKEYKMAVALFQPDDCVQILKFDAGWSDFTEYKEEKSNDEEKEERLNIDELPKLEGVLLRHKGNSLKVDDLDLLISGYFDEYIIDKLIINVIRMYYGEEVFVMIKGPFFLVNENEVKLSNQFDKNKMNIIIQVMAITKWELNENVFMVVTMNENGDDHKQYLFEANDGDHWVTTIQSFINQYH